MNSSQELNLDTDELRCYALAISHKAETSSSDIFRNSGSCHALIVFQNIFLHSKSIVRLLAGNLRNAVTSDKRYQEAIVTFLRDPKHRLEIVLDSYKSIDNTTNKEAGNLSIFDILYPYRQQITIRKTNQYLSAVINGKGRPIHLCLGDDKIYRIETDITQRQAEGCFNAPQYTQSLIPIFEEIFTKAEDIEWKNLIPS